MRIFTKQVMTNQNPRMKVAIWYRVRVISKEVNQSSLCTLIVKGNHVVNSKLGPFLFYMDLPLSLLLKARAEESPNDFNQGRTSYYKRRSKQISNS